MFNLSIYAKIAQLVEQPLRKRQVRGSIPRLGSFCFLFFCYTLHFKFFPGILFLFCYTYREVLLAPNKESL